MLQLGCALSAEEQTPQELIRNTIRAEQAGFSFVAISDHFHPWTNSQGQSAFIWSVLGAISQVTKSIKVMTGVTAPIIRIHPAILAQATATTASLFGDRFIWGVGTGENLNEHVVGMGWPSYETRAEMLKESITIIRKLWEGEMTTIEGNYYRVDTARIYSLPEQPPPIIVSAFGPKSVQLAAEIGDGLITTSADKIAVAGFIKAGGKNKPLYGQMKVVVAASEDEAKKTAYKYWPHSAFGGEADQELRVPKHFEELGKSATPEMVAKNYVCTTNPQDHVTKIKGFVDAGYDHVAIGQIGPDQEAFFSFYEKEIFPQLRTIQASGEVAVKKAKPSSSSQRQAVQVKG